MIIIQLRTADNIPLGGGKRARKEAKINAVSFSVMEHSLKLCNEKDFFQFSKSQWTQEWRALLTSWKIHQQAKLLDLVFGSSLWDPLKELCAVLGNSQRWGLMEKNWPRWTDDEIDLIIQQDVTTCLTAEETKEQQF